MIDIFSDYPRYQNVASKHKLPSYFLSAFMNFAKETSFTDKRILEIGGSSLPQELVFDLLEAQQWTCVDILNHDAGAYQKKDFSHHYDQIGIRHLTSAHDILETKGYQIFDGGAEEIPTSFNEHYDIVISINAFEHILNLEAVIEKLHKCLKRGGILLAQFGPIWSGVKGSHFWVNDSLNFMDNGFVPPWAHLLMSENELRYYLQRANISEDIVNIVLDQFYHSSFINRLHFEDYCQIFDRSNFSEVKITGLWDWVCPSFIKNILIEKYGDKNYESIGMFISGRKA